MAAEEFYFKPRNIKGATESSTEGAAVMAGLPDMRRIPRDHSVFRFDTNVLQVGDFRAGASDVILELLQAYKRGIRTKRFGYVIAEMPSFAGVVARQILIEVVVLKTLHGNFESRKCRNCIKTE